MRLPAKGLYAVAAMLDMALKPGAEPVILREIAANHRISVSYLEQIFAKLRRRGLAEGTRGLGGGYRLSRPANTITIAEIMAICNLRLDSALSGARDRADYVLR